MATQSIRERLRDQSGQILVLTAVSMVALLGIAALALDASFMTAKRNRLHGAADAAAKSAAIEIVRNSAAAQAVLEAFADQQVTAHGLTPSRQGGTTSVVINRPPTTGAFAGNASYVEAIVSETTDTFFGKVLGFANMTPGAVAVAGAGSPNDCLITTQGLSFGNTKLTLNGCGAAVGANLAGTNPNAAILGTPLPPVGVVGTCTGTCGAMGSLSIGAPAPTDPLSSLPDISSNPYGTCVSGAAATLAPGCYTDIKNTVTTLSSTGTGIFYVTGKVDVGNLTGSNVLLYLAPGASFTATNNSAITLVGRSSGTYTGVAIFQDRANSNLIDIDNNFTMNVTGAIYMPSVDIDFKNSLSIVSTTCTLFIAKSLTIKNGNGALTSSGCGGAFAGALFLSASIAQ